MKNNLIHSKKIRDFRNLKQIGLAVTIWTQENDERLPIAADDLFSNALGLAGAVVKCPDRTNLTVGYVYNYELSNKVLADFPDPTATLLAADGLRDTFATTAILTSAGLTKRLNTAYVDEDFDKRHGGKLLQVYLDTHVTLEKNPEGFNGLSTPPIINDIFDNRTLAGATNTLLNNSITNNLSFFANGASLSIINSSTFGSQALQLNAGVIAVGTIPTIANLTNVGDQLTLSFSLNLTGVPASRGNALSFGLYNSYGTPINVASFNSSSNNYQGYFVTTSMTNSTPYPNYIYEEKGGASFILGGNDYATLYSTASVAGASITATGICNVSLTLTRLASNQIRINSAATGTASYDNTVVDDGVLGGATYQTVAPFTAFDSIAFRAVPQMEIDNIKLEFTPGG